jgi:WD40 repeat-containing protein SMU1
VIELVELKEIGAARSLLRQTDPMHLLKDLFPDRYLSLERLVSINHFDAKEVCFFAFYFYFNGIITKIREIKVYGSGSKEKRRQVIAQSIASEVSVVAPSRLLSLLGQSLKWQASQGLLPEDGAFDLFRGTTPAAKIEDDMPPTHVYQTIKFPKKAAAECATFSPDGQYLATGTMDGLIEIWNYMTGKLRKDLTYQADNCFMMHDAAVLSLSFSKSGENLVSGCQDGKIKVGCLIYIYIIHFLIF